MSDRWLLERVSELGFPLIESNDAEATLADVIKSGDLRLWEGFPVMLAHAFQHKTFDRNAIISHLDKPGDKRRLEDLMKMSLALYKSMNRHIPRAEKHFAAISPRRSEEIVKLSRKIREGEDFTISGIKMSSQRLKEIFMNYYTDSPQQRMGEYLAAKDEMDMEYALSQIFTSRQKDLIFKKLKGDKLTKTEREYYSRAVKKKLAALANPDIHRLAQRVMQS